MQAHGWVQRLVMAMLLAVAAFFPDGATAATGEAPQAPLDVASWSYADSRGSFRARRLTIHADGNAMYLLEDNAYDRDLMPGKITGTVPAAMLEELRKKTAALAFSGYPENTQNQTGPGFSRAVMRTLRNGQGQIQLSQGRNHPGPAEGFDEAESCFLRILDFLRSNGQSYLFAISLEDISGDDAGRLLFTIVFANKGNAPVTINNPFRVNAILGLGSAKAGQSRVYRKKDLEILKTEGPVSDKLVTLQGDSALSMRFRTRTPVKKGEYTLTPSLSCVMIDGNSGKDLFSFREKIVSHSHAGALLKR